MRIVTIILIITNFYSVNIRQTSWVPWTHLVQGLGNLIVEVRWKIHQQMIGCSWNLGGISESEKVSFQMVMEQTTPFDDLICSWGLPNISSCRSRRFCSTFPTSVARRPLTQKVCHTACHKTKTYVIYTNIDLPSCCNIPYQLRCHLRRRQTAIRMSSLLQSFGLSVYQWELQELKQQENNIVTIA